MADAVAYMRPSPREDIEVADQPLVLPGVVDGCSVDSDAESEWDLSDILPHGATDAWSSLVAEFTIIRA